MKFWFFAVFSGIANGLDECLKKQLAHVTTLGCPPGVQGATVLHRLACLFKIAIQGATQGAAKCNIGCYILQSLRFDRPKSKVQEGPNIPLKMARNRSL